MTSFFQCNQGDSFRLHALAGPTFYVMCNSIYTSIPQVVYMYVLIDTWIFFPGLDGIMNQHIVLILFYYYYFESICFL